MTTWFTSDTHFGHARIIELADRPFASVEEMNEALVERWNERVAPEDTVIHLGDVALGPIEESLKYIERLNGFKILVVGNHDRPFPPMQKGNLTKVSNWTERYREAGFDLILRSFHFKDEAIGPFNGSHFPYDGDSHDAERFREYRLDDEAIPLVHGHTHSNGVVTRSNKGTLQVHVGVDAWDFRPVSVEEIQEILDSNS
jgi:calcineurin-like phosphoesterase family protein